MKLRLCKFQLKSVKGVHVDVLLKTTSETPPAAMSWATYKKLVFSIKKINETFMFSDAVLHYDFRKNGVPSNNVANDGALFHIELIKQNS